MAKKDFEKVISEKDQYNQETRDVISSMSFVKNELIEIEATKRTQGWKILDKKIREELHERITFLVKDDLKIQTLLALLKVADTKSQIKILNQEIDKILPDE